MNIKLYLNFLIIFPVDARLEACEDPSEPPYRGTLTEKLNYLIDNAKDITFHTPSISRFNCVINQTEFK